MLGVPDELPDSGSKVRLADTIRHIGASTFSESLFALASEKAGANHCFIGELGGDGLATLGVAGSRGPEYAISRYRMYEAGRCWRFDPVVQAMTTLQAGDPRLMHLPKSDLDMAAATAIYGHDISDRLVYAGSWNGRKIVLALFRSNAAGLFGATQVEWLEHFGDELLALIARHADFMQQNHAFLTAVTSRDEIEACLASSPAGLAAREVSVCACLLLGLSIPVIATELGIGQETVITYRKRAYLKLGISTQRELLPLYIRRWLDFQQETALLQ